MHVQLGAKTLAMALPVWIVCAYDEQGKANPMAAAWAGVCCSKPPCVYASIRESRYTYNCIQHSRAFTINTPGSSQVEAADYFGMVSGKSTDKLADAGLTPVRSNFVNAPYIAEFPLALHCRLVQELNLGSHWMLVGEILETTCDESFLNDDGLPDISKIKPFSYSTATGAYYTVGSKIGSAYSLGKAIQSSPGRNE